MSNEAQIELGNTPREGPVEAVVGKPSHLTTCTNPIKFVPCAVDAGIDNNTATNIPQTHHSSPSEAVYSDASGALFSIYLQTADEEDTKMTESWKGDADGILVFVCLQNNLSFLAFS